MSENLNWIDRLRQSFENFEPKVEGNWNAMQKRLDVSGYSASELDMVRRVRAARRFAFGASVVAAGLALWMVIPEVAEQELLSTELENSMVEASEIENGIISEDAEASAQKVQAAISDVHRSNYLSEGLPLKLDPALIGRSYDADAVQLDPDVTARTTTTFILNLPEMTVEASAKTGGASDSATKRKGETKTMAEGFIEGRSEAENEDGSKDSMGSSDYGPYRAAVPASSATINRSGTSIDRPVENSERNDATAFNISVQEACAGTEVSFELNGLELQGSVLWNFGDGGFSQEISPSHIYENAGTYDITVSVRAPGDGTIRTRTVENMIVVRPKPEARMNWEFQDATAERAQVHFINETEEASSCTWLLENVGLKGSEAILDVPGAYHLNLVASNAYGCQDIAVEDIYIGSRREAIAPALFSPDGDGRYDTFMPLMVLDYKGDWTLTVWDGEKMVFETSRERNPWNGQVKGGGTAVVGKKYIWKLETVTPVGVKHLYVDEVLIDG